MADAQINHADARQYWQSIPADVNGMLGGFPYISKVDLQGSRAFLVKLGVCGEGRKIGRITSGLLLYIAEVVDIVEPIAKFSNALIGVPGIGEIYTTGLESWSPSRTPGYDLIWNQWCVGHLTDVQLVAYLRKCGEALREGGFVVVKENLSTDPGGEDVFDEVDSSITRTDKKFRALFEEAGMKVKRTEIQNGLPSELYPVKIYGLQPVVISATPVVATEG
ncbi:hypothetical protein HYALB_00007045 [Hymenoscyphus albidus]|uniref:Alpha N-terminal protein methyltransferase 1 n=1 Tax=Hymenoscyphus albidus TaxID=595503 RepID=A0A9N9Q2N6_9HELO|nr:hypothetical protein HYALB_00007045 [Hymenoscyphus albidus]